MHSAFLTDRSWKLTSVNIAKNVLYLNMSKNIFCIHSYKGLIRNNITSISGIKHILEERSLNIWKLYMEYLSTY